MSLQLTNEMQKLRRLTLAQCALVEDRVGKAVEAMRVRSQELAAMVIDGDGEVDSREIGIDEECLKILALHHPVAADLRFVMSVVKINNFLERIGDLAVNLAKKARKLSRGPEIPVPPSLWDMAERARDMLGQGVDAFVESDDERAYAIIGADAEINRLKRRTRRAVAQAIEADRTRVAPLLAILAASRNLERIADMVCNIAEEVIYNIAGKIVRHGHDGDEDGEEEE